MVKSSLCFQRSCLRTPLSCYTRQNCPSPPSSLGPLQQSRTSRRCYVTYAPSQGNRDQKAPLGLPQSHINRPLNQSGGAHGDWSTRLRKASRVVETPSEPDEATLLDALGSCQRLALTIAEASPGSSALGKQSKPATTSAFTDSIISQLSQTQRDEWKDKIADTAYRIITNPKTFITPAILEVYISALSALRRPHTFPYIFDLYAVKPTPQPSSTPVTYTEANPNSVKAAVPLSTASAALDAAIDSRDLALCLSVIQTTVSTSAYVRNRCLRKAAPSVFAVGCTPLMSHQLATAWADYSDRLEPGFAFWMSFACFMTFFASTSVTGYVAVTTSYNSNRVVWRSGTPLYQRWTRKQEREFADRVAQAWGFRNHYKRGEEEGDEWKFLKEWTKERSMHLDKPELMEGME